uniref:Phytocyanin domain-containing protein n=1 Tax=Kalanchoe fedtschenkoi TaxID=63787 RepID=A0A7N0VDL3_KALFE
MVGLRFALAMFLAVAAAASLGGGLVGAQVHHVVGGDRGWDPDSGVGSWSSGRVFSVGDKLWFTYSAGKESIVELRTKQDYESCDVTNPIRMYTDGINSLSLDEEGLRYFASSKAESCENGLKLRVDVKPRSSPWEIQGVATSEGSAVALAEGPSSSSFRLKVDWAGAGVVAVVVGWLGFYSLAM